MRSVGIDDAIKKLRNSKIKQKELEKFLGKKEQFHSDLDQINSVKDFAKNHSKKDKREAPQRYGVDEE